VTVVKNVPLAKSISVEPLDSDDWEIVELNANAIEEGMLSQIRMVYAWQHLILRVQSNALVRLKITAVDPATASCLRLDNDTEVYVAPKPRKKAEQSLVSEIPKTPSDGVPFQFSWRALPTSAMPNQQLFRPDTIYAHPDLLKSNHILLSGPQQLVNVAAKKSEPGADTVVVWLKSCDEVVGKDVLVVPDGVLQALEIQPLSVIKLHSLESHDFPMTEVALCPLNIESLEKANCFLHACGTWIESYPLVLNLNSNQVLHHDNNIYKARSSAVFRVCLVTSPKQLSLDAAVVKWQPFHLERWQPVLAAGLETITEQICDHIDACSATVVHEPAAVLITGLSGCGKSTLARSIAHALHHQLKRPYFVKHLMCSDLVHSQHPDELKSYFQSTFHALQECAPSLLVLEDAEVLLSRGTEVIALQSSRSHDSAIDACDCERACPAI
jgi:hypothetical protein